MRGEGVDTSGATAARYAGLVRVSEALRTYHDTETLFRCLAQELRPLVRFSFLGLALFDERTRVVTPRVLEATGEPATPPVLTSDDQLTYWVLDQGRPLVIPDLNREERFAEETRYLLSQGAVSACCLPLLTPQRKVGMLITGSRESHLYEESDLAFLSLVANQVALAIDDALNFGALQDSLAVARDRLHTLNACDALLQALSPALDVRGGFDHVANVARDLVPHDHAALFVVATDDPSITVHATSPNGLAPAARLAITRGMRAWLSDPWDVRIIRDVAMDADARELPTPMPEARGVLRVAIRDHESLVGVLEFSSQRPDAYDHSHVQPARRVANYIALALSHERLADERSRAAALRERTANLESLDGLLSTLGDVLDVRQVFPQLSAIAQKVIAHDSLSLPLFSSDGEHFIIHAVTATEFQSPMTVPLPAHQRWLLSEPWEYVIHADLQTDPLEAASPPTTAGYRSRLAVPIRVQGQLLGGLDFLSRTPNVYTKDDVIVARRIADHVALALSHQRLAEEVQRSTEARERAAQLERRVSALSAEVNALGGHRNVVGESPPWRQALKQATQVAATDTTVLILGESGTGKEVVARFVHRASARSGGPFVALNCAALPEPLLESELFGFERGAFTGALQAKPGQLEQASGGVLFLDEVGEMSPSVQAKFLRVLQEREFQRLGGTRTVRANVRVVAATNKNLRAAVDSGAFREDLFYRLNVFAIRLPPLRERKDDIFLLCDAFLRDIAHSFGRPPAGLAREAREALVEYSWPGNIRELRNVLERASILCEGGLITTEHLTLAAPTDDATSTPRADRSTSAHLPQMERAAIERALSEAGGNKSLAATRLGLTRKQLYVRLRRHGLR